MTEQMKNDIVDELARLVDEVGDYYFRSALEPLNKEYSNRAWQTKRKLMKRIDEILEEI